ncbi:SDR family oxidoreductase [bacterium]|nr:SDR family oxidoreductase [bacterium]
MKRILVTGGAGFLGSHLCDYLLKEGHDVICLDNFFTGSKDNIRHLLGNPHFELLRHDIVQPILLETDQIYNLACPASPIHYQYNPVKTTKTSVMGVINMLGLAKRVKARLLQASTSEIYGNPTVHPQREEYWGNVNTVGIRSCYDEGKRVAETLCADYHRQNGVEVRIARIFNTFGPRMALNDGRVVSNLVLQALRGEPLTLFGDGSQTRSFCYVDDMIVGLVRLMNSDYDESPVNLGNPREITILELAEKISGIMSQSSRIEYRTLPEDDPVRRCPDISLAGRVLDWKPQVSLEDGLTKTIEYFRSKTVEAQ